MRPIPQLVIAATAAAAAPAAAATATYDVLVYDATSGGITAAVAAVRNGVPRVAVLCASWPACFDEGGRIVGGMTTNGLGQSDIGGHDVFGGLAREFYHRNWLHYFPNGTAAGNGTAATPGSMQSCRLPSDKCNVTANVEPHVGQAIFEDMLAEAGVEVIFNAELQSTSTDAATHRITAVTVGDAATGAVTEYTATVFIDASYEGDLMAAAGVSYVTGREGVAEFNESLAGHQTYSAANAVDLVVSPFVNGIDGRLIDFVHPYTDAVAPGGADDNVPSYNFRLCVTKDPANLVPFDKPADYDPAAWELVRRYVNACEAGAGGKAPPALVAADGRAGASGISSSNGHCQMGYPSCNLGALPGKSKFDMNNCGGVASDFIGASKAYPRANWTARKQIWQAHLSYTQGLLWTLGHDPAVPAAVRAEMAQWGLCADEFRNNTLAPHWPPGLYVREARRMHHDDIFHQNTPAQHAGVNRSDAIGLAAYNFDSHNVRRFWCSNATAWPCDGHGPMDSPANVSATTPFVFVEGDIEINPGLYQIPYSVMVPSAAEATNLLVVSTMAATHIGLSSLRMEPQFLIVGEAAGTAAAQAFHKSSTVQDVNLTALQATLVGAGARIYLPWSGPPAPAAVTVSGAGTAGVNGVYMHDSAQQRDQGTPFYRLDDAHELYRLGGQWRIADPGQTELFYLGAGKTNGTLLPPTGAGAWEVVPGRTTGAQPSPTTASARVTTSGDVASTLR